MPLTEKEERKMYTDIQRCAWTMDQVKEQLEKGDETLGNHEGRLSSLEVDKELLVCELDIPERKYVHSESIVNGETIVESSEKELKLGEVTMIEYLKEVNKI
jgi:hypothetical protein